MYKTIKARAEAAIALQNKLVMETTLREIIGICDAEKHDMGGGATAVMGDGATYIESADKAAETMVAGEKLATGDEVVQVSSKAKKAAKK